MTSKVVSWTTRDETCFLDGIGTHTLSPVLTVAGRIVLLQQYIDTMSLRADWGDIDPDKVRQYAQTRIRQFIRPVQPTL